ncbi:hypothetical protein [Bradyrhizobium sp. 195]|uniref:hypothetical protein n=1 Tax=Bradyrhizobium sp. 195 TaxID=2782662 RepID=UPI002000726A|nr:hypothetical protein [Bradyrhizobium sp. 195]
MNLQVTVLKILVSYPDGFALMAELKRDMAILATSGPEWTERTKRLASRMPNLDIFSQGLIERTGGGWRITDNGRAALELMEARPAAADPTVGERLVGRSKPATPSLSLPLEWGRCRSGHRQRRRAAGEEYCRTLPKGGDVEGAIGSSRQR